VLVVAVRWAAGLASSGGNGAWSQELIPECTLGGGRPKCDLMQAGKSEEG